MKIDSQCLEFACLNSRIDKLEQGNVCITTEEAKIQIDKSDVDMKSLQRVTNDENADQGQGQAGQSESASPPPKGCYFKVGRAPHIYWSVTGKPDRQDLKFESPEAYNIHRKKHGWPQDWSGIVITPAPGCYWKHKEDPTVYYSQTKAGIKQLSFADEKAFLKHRQECGFKRDWSGIVKIERGNYWKASKLPHVHWNAMTARPPAEVTFLNADEYLQHRLAHGMAQDWSDIKVVCGAYWQRKGNPTIWWAEDGKHGTETLSFPDVGTYLAHRKLLGFPPDFSAVAKI
mmetsp:Transcript_20535/g.28870  ORF Transcript_20535/g.28870 Transcript_20535/m.28870 type:complete len:287 (-) Transcript_20535:50-910(-)|eukprot:CAMPEP_0185272776 /NCGR_PEP_ID=MMETSP1359-20130426/48078_1 /TAXON_ID=552665 /ORGANISM="Bigelowiella longifila, Strain CCMP242" /LENGTH=286 /DNA_ID=CAMNT_0027865193 /DNA_START=71 /DNA_END=931 /DNA_ORIENTATION=+